MTPEDQAEMAAIHWWHRIPLGDGVVTPGYDTTQWKIDLMQLPPRLDGEAVLDVGAWDGAVSFECERRGAARIVAYDDPEWSWGPKSWGSASGAVASTGRRGFDFARRILGSKVEGVEGDVYDYPVDFVGAFDRVIFAGVLYHLRHPLLALEGLRALVRPGGVLHVETVIAPGDEVVARFFEHGELDGDPNNWWAPTVPCATALLRAAGFAEARHAGSSGYRAAFVAH